MTLNLQKRFLLLFADYRDAVDGQQWAQDELLILRSEKQELQSRLDATLKDSLDRERQLTERLLRGRLGDKFVDGPSASSGAIKPSSTVDETPQDWQKRKENEFMNSLMKRRAELMGDGSEAA